MAPETAAIVVRSLYLLCLYQAAGAVLFWLGFAAAAPQSRDAITRLAARAALLGAVLATGHQVLQAAVIAGEWPGLGDPLWHRLAIEASGGPVHALQVVALLALWALLCRRPVAGRRLALLAALVAALALLLSGHVSVHPERAWLAPLLGLHLVLVAFWLGSLGPLWLIAGRESPPVAAAIVARFSAWAGVLVPLILVAGVTLFAVLTRGFDGLDQPYGQLVIAKLVLFLVIMPLAAFNKWRAGPALASGAAGARRRLRASIAAEAVLIAAIVSVTAVLTSLYSPA